MIKHPNVGLRLPDDLDHHEIMKFVKPYLGKLVSTSSDWNILQHKPNVSKDDMWQFKTFLVN
jgi:homospermidine synthase